MKLIELAPKQTQKLEVDIYYVYFEEKGKVLIEKAFKERWEAEKFQRELSKSHDLQVYCARGSEILAAHPYLGQDIWESTDEKRDDDFGNYHGWLDSGIDQLWPEARLKRDPTTKNMQATVR